MDNEKAQVLNPVSLSSLDAWVKKTAIKLVQVNGQRKYGGPPPDWSGPVPGPGCEVYISQIPRDMYEDQLIPLFQSVGPLYEFRLMMNFSGQNRGFAYAKYADPHVATTVILRLHQHKLQEGVRLVVRRSTEKRQLLLGGLPPSIERELLLRVLRDVSEGVETVYIKSTKRDKDVSAVVHYYSHYAASMAKKVLCEAFHKMFAIRVTVKWMVFTGKPMQVLAQKKSTVSLPPCFLQTSAKLRLLPPGPLDRGIDAAVGQHLQLHQAANLGREDPANVDAVGLLKKVCCILEVGPPLFHIQYRHTGPDGFLYFNFRVEIPGLPQPFMGNARTLPGSSRGATRDEIHQAAAEHVLKAYYQA